MLENQKLIHQKYEGGAPLGSIVSITSDVPLRKNNNQGYSPSVINEEDSVIPEG